MPKWLKCISQCFRYNRNEFTGEAKNAKSTDFENDKIIEQAKTKNGNSEEITITKNESTEEKSKIILPDETSVSMEENLKELQQQIEKNQTERNATKRNVKGKLTELEGYTEENVRKHITCTLHESLDDFSLSKVTHTSLKPRSLPRSNKEKPCSTLIFQTVMLNGEPCTTTRYKTTEEVEPNLEQVKTNSEEQDKKVAEEIEGSEIKLVFSHDVLEYLTKSFLHNNGNDLNRTNEGANDTVVCTLFPKYINVPDGTNDRNLKIDNNMEVDTNMDSMDVDDDTANNSNEILNNSMDIDDVSDSTDDNNSTIMQTENNNVFHENQFSPRSEYRLIPISATNQMIPININSPISKSSPQMQENNNNNSKEITRLRRNMSKKVSWKENVEVCFFNHSSKSANEILQEEQPLIDHEVYWKECVGEMDRKRREIWLKVRADEQRCLTGDGQFHDYFACRTHHFGED